MYKQGVCKNINYTCKRMTETGICKNQQPRSFASKHIRSRILTFYTYHRLNISLQVKKRNILIKRKEENINICIKNQLLSISNYDYV